MKRYQFIYLAALLAVGAAIAVAALAADPGSREDPLATVGYVQAYAQFERLELAGGQSLSLGPACEFIVVKPGGQLVSLEEFDPKVAILLNLSTGNRLDGNAVQAYQLYLNAGEQPLRFMPASPVTLLVRGGRE